MIRRAHIDARRHTVDDTDRYATLLGAAERLLAATIAPYRVLSRERRVALSRAPR
jgi:hypothetical protein